MRKIRLSVVDNHPVVHMGIRHVLNRIQGHMIELVKTYDNAAQVMYDINKLTADVFIISMSLPDTPGYKLAQEIKEVNPEIKIGIYSYTLERDSVYNSFSCGALGYILKSASMTDFLDFVITISKGDRYYKERVADVLYEQRNKKKKQGEVKITKRESEVLRLIMSGLKNKEIACKLSITERTVEFHRQNIYNKFNVSNTAQLFKTNQQLSPYPFNNKDFNQYN